MMGRNLLNKKTLLAAGVLAVMSAGSADAYTITDFQWENQGTVVSSDNENSITSSTANTAPVSVKNSDVTLTAVTGSNTITGKPGQKTGIYVGSESGQSVFCMNAAVDNIISSADAPQSGIQARSRSFSTDVSLSAGRNNVIYAKDNALSASSPNNTISIEASEDNFIVSTGTTGLVFDSIAAGSYRGGRIKIASETGNNILTGRNGAVSVSSANSSADILAQKGCNYLSGDTAVSASDNSFVSITASEDTNFINGTSIGVEIQQRRPRAIIRPPGYFSFAACRSLCAVCA